MPVESADEDFELALACRSHQLVMRSSFQHNCVMRDRTVMIKDDVNAAAQQIAENSGSSLEEVISQLPRNGLVSEPSFPIKHGVPVFRVDVTSSGRTPPVPRLLSEGLGK